MSAKPPPLKTLVLLDAHAIIHRAYHALPEFMSSDGKPTGALYGLSAMLMKIINELKPDYIAACYDLPGKTFRHEVYDGYKALRAKADEALITQLKDSHLIFEAFNIPRYDSPGFEADDVIGTIVQHSQGRTFKNSQGSTFGLKIIIASGDMDTMQLVDDKRVQVYTLKKGINDTILYDEERMTERFGFPPQLLPDYKGLRGDPSDNIIGIKGIGEKTATNLIAKFGTVEEIYKKLKIESEKFKEIGLSERIINLLKDNEEEALFSKTLAKIRTDAPVDFALPAQTFWQSADREKIKEIFSRFGFRSLLARLPNFFGDGPSVAEQPESSPDQPLLKETSIALWLLNSDVANPTLPDILAYAKTQSLEKANEIILRQLKEDKLEKVFTEIEKPIIPAVEAMENYGILINPEYFAKLSSEYHRELDKLTAKIHRLAGTDFNINSPSQLAEVLFDKLQIKGRRKKSPSGKFSTKISVLEELEEDNPIIKEIIAYRELQKLLSTYVDVIPLRAGPDGRLHARFLQNGTTTGRFSSEDPNLQNLPIKSALGRRIRTGFIAPSGAKLLAFDYSQIELRVAAILSGDKKMTRIFREGRDAHTGVASFVFGVPPEAVDAEMRRRAKVINFGIIYGMGVSALQKNLGGPALGGASTRAEAQKFYDNYFRQFAGIRDYLEMVKVFTLKNGYTETLFGRKRRFPNINSKISYLQNMALRTATNAPLQGTAADIIKLAIRFVEEDLAKNGLDSRARLVLQIHDELVYEIDEEVLSEARDIIKRAMEAVLPRSYLNLKAEVPLQVRVGAGDNLDEVK